MVDGDNPEVEIEAIAVWKMVQIEEDVGLYRTL